MLTISFIIPTYNAGCHIESCLKSIRSQRYPQDKIKIIISDGGSSDNTLDIARKYGCQIFKNMRKLAEYGLQLGVQQTQTDLLVVFAADNELIGSNWIQKVTDIFSNDREISAVWGRLASGPRDSALNRYFELIQSDPLNWFLNKNLSQYRAEAQIYERNFFKFRVDPQKPLVWGANGLVYKTKKARVIWMQEGYLGDNDAFQYMIEQGDNKVAYFHGPFVYHHHVVRLGDWVKKWRRNLNQHLLNKQATRNMRWVFSGNFKIKLFIWSIYAAIPIFSILHSIYLSCKDKNISWLYHPLVSFAQFFTYASLIISRKAGLDFINRGMLKVNRVAKIDREKGGR